MKQNLIACVLFLFFGVLGVKSEPVILALHHEGNGTFYYDYQFDAAQESQFMLLVVARIQLLMVIWFL